MPRSLIIKLLAGAIGVSVFIYLFFIVGVYLRNEMTGGYWRFLEKDRRFYTEFARGCDSILKSHPVGTNKSISVEVTDSSVPKIIQELGPTKITSASNRSWMMIGESRAGFGIAWEPQPEGQTNVWAINTYAENLIRTPYVETNR
jgi:hypothetical protein